MVSFTTSMGRAQLMKMLNGLKVCMRAGRMRRKEESLLAKLVPTVPLKTAIFPLESQTLSIASSLLPQRGRFYLGHTRQR